VPVAVRRLIYSLLSALGFALMVPLAANMRRFQMEFLADPAALDPGTVEWAQRLLLLFGVGLILATSFLYAALTTGHARAWRPRENGSPRCRRCGAEVRFGIRRCPTCDQQLAW
jgi:hypothetical protein